MQTDVPTTMPAASRRGRRRDALAAVLLLAGLLGGCPSPEHRLAGHFARADRYLEAGRQREALIELRNALREDPGSAEAAFRIARLLDDNGEVADAAFFYAEARRLDPERVDIPLAEARLLLQTQPQRAEELLAAVLERDPANAMARVRRSELALVRGDLDAAFRAAREAFDGGADVEGAAALQLGIVERARLVRGRIAGDPFDANLAQSALDALQKAEVRGGSAWRVAFERASVLALWPGREGEADPLYRRAVERAEKTAPRREHRDVLLQAFRFSLAGENRALTRWVLERWVKTDPADLFAWQRLARLEAQEGGYPTAIYQRLLRERPEDPNAHVFYARELASDGRTQDAIAHLEQAAHHLQRDRSALLAELVRLELSVRDLSAAGRTLAELEHDAPNRAETALSRARLRIGENRLEEAATVLRVSAALANSVPAQQLLAETELRLGQPELALPPIERALALAHGRQPRLWRMKARAEHELGRWKEALQSFRELSTSGGALQRLDLVRVARCYYELGQPRQGRALLEPLLRQAHPLPRAVLEFARREAAREPQAAREALEAALRDRPRDPRLHALLTQIDLGESHEEEALERLNRALAAGPESPGLLLGRARLLARQGDYEAARADVRRALRAEPDSPEGVRLFARLEAASNRRDKTLAELEARGEVLEPWEQSLLARLYRERGDPERARGIQERLLERDANYAGVKSDLAYTLAEAHEQLDRAVRLAREARTTLGDEPSVIDTLGYVYLRRELPELALDEFRRAIDVAELRGEIDPLLYYHRGLALRALGRFDEARQAFERALGVDPHFADARAALQALDPRATPTPQRPAS